MASATKYICCYVLQYVRLVDAEIEQNQSRCANPPPPPHVAPAPSYDRRSTRTYAAYVCTIAPDLQRPVEIMSPTPADLGIQHARSGQRHVRPSHCPFLRLVHQKEDVTCRRRGQGCRPSRGASKSERRDCDEKGFPVEESKRMVSHKVNEETRDPCRCCCCCCCCCRMHQASSIKHQAPSPLFCSTEARATKRARTPQLGATVTAPPVTVSVPGSDVSWLPRRGRTVLLTTVARLRLARFEVQRPVQT